MVEDIVCIDWITALLGFQALQEAGLSHFCPFAWDTNFFLIKLILLLLLMSNFMTSGSHLWKILVYADKFCVDSVTRSSVSSVKQLKMDTSCALVFIVPLKSMVITPC